MVEPLTAGNIERHDASTNAGLSTAVVGVFNGCVLYRSNYSKANFKNYYPGSIAASDITAFVVDDPDAVFLIDADEAFTRADFTETMLLLTLLVLHKQEYQKYN